MLIFGYKSKGKRVVKKLQAALQEIVQNPSSTASVINEIMNAQRNLAGITVTNKEEFRNLKEALDLVKPMKIATMSRNYTTANTYCEQIVARIGGEIPSDEIYKRMMAALQDQRRKMEGESKAKQRLLDHDSEDIIARSDLEVLRIRIANTKERIELFANERNRTAVVKAIDGLNKDFKQALAYQNTTDEEFELALNQLNSLRTELKKRSRMADDGTDEIIHGGETTHTAIQTSPRVYSSQTTASTYASRVSQQPVRTTETAPTMHSPLNITTPYSGQKSSVGEMSNEELEEAYAAAEGAIESLRSEKATIQEKMNHLQEQINKGSAALRELLTQRKQLPELSRLVLDMNIDDLNMQVTSCVAALKRFANEFAQLNQIEDVARKAYTERNVAELRNLYNFANSFTSRIESVAMDIGTRIKEANEQLDHYATVAKVASQEEIMTRPYGEDTTIVEKENISDDDKYAALEKKLGMRE